MKACILYLVDTRSVAEFRKSLELLRKISALKSYPILAFHETDYPAEIRAELSDQFGVQFHEITFSRARYSAEIEANIPERFVLPHCSFSMGYRHMCRFFAGEIFKRPELRPFDYAMRLDTDSYLYEPMEDSFQVLAASGAVYGFRLISADHPLCFAGFYEAFRRAVEGAGYRYRLGEEMTVQPIGHPEPIHLPSGEIESKGYVYYNNFEVSKLDYFRSDPYMQVYEKVERTGGFFVHRWGDALFRLAFLTQFQVPVLRFSFKYGHADRTYSPEEWHQ